MGKNNIVCLPKNTTPVFPDRCAHCGSPKPPSTVVFKEVGQVATERFAVPICEACAPRMRRRNAIRTWLLAGAYVPAAIVSALAFPLSGLAKTTPAMAGYIILVVLVIGACFAPWAVYNWRAPVPLFLMHDMLHKRVIYSFRDPKYAEDFAVLNGTKTGVPK